MTWVILITGEEMSDITTYLVSGTKSQVKRHLVNCIKEDADEMSDYFTEGTLDALDLEELPDEVCGTNVQAGSIKGYAKFGNYGRTYTAMLSEFCTTRVLDDEGRY